MNVHPLPIVRCVVPRLRKVAVVGALILGLAGCATVAPTPTSTCDAPSRNMVVDTLYFGTDRGAGLPVSEGQWRAFVDQIVAPRFPSGLTHWSADGQWRNARGELILESSFVLVVAHEGSREGEGALRQIEASWRTQFEQESVMRVRTRACVSF